MSKPSLSDIPGQTKKIEATNGDVIEYSVAETTFNKSKLEKEKARLEHDLAIPEPTDAELIEMMKQSHPWYTRDTAAMTARITEINELLATTPE